MNANPDLANFPTPPHPRGDTLIGKHVRLEALNPVSHSKDLFEANSLDAEGANWDYLPYGPFGSFENYLTWLESVADKEDPFFLAIVRLSDNKPVGVASFMAIDRPNGSIEVGHINFSPLLQRTTAATEAMFLMMRWAFENGYRRYQWRCNSKNIPSRRAAQRLGLSFEGVFRQNMIVKGQNRDTAWFAAVDSEWPALKAAFESYLSPENFDQTGVPLDSLSSLTQSLLFSRDPLVDD